MKDPEPYDDGYLDKIGKVQQKEFAKLFTKEYKGIDIDTAKTSYKRAFEDSYEPKYVLFRSVVDAFSPKDEADGSDSGFETTIVNPLFEKGLTSSEILLARKLPSGVHLCFVSCNVGRDGEENWRKDIDKIKRVLNEGNNQDLLLKHIQCGGIDIQSVQYITLTRDLDLVDVDVKTVKLGTNPENYAIWTLIQSNQIDEDDEQEIIYHTGDILHPELRKICKRGIDPTTADNDDIRYCFTTHPVYPIGKVCMEIYFDGLGREEEPKEFTTTKFAKFYEKYMRLGTKRESVSEVLSKQVDDLLESACDWGVLEELENIDSSTKKYRIKWETDEGGDIKDSVKDKYIKYKAPEEMGEIAFQEAKEDYQKPEHELTDYDDESN